MADSSRKNTRSDRDRIRNITDRVNGPDVNLDAPEERLTGSELAKRKEAQRHRQAVMERRRRIRRKKRVIAYFKLLLAFLIIAGIAIGAFVVKNYHAGSDHDNKGMEAMQNGNYELAVREFKEAVSYDQDSASYLIHLGMAYAAEGSCEEALGYFTQADGCARTDEERVLSLRGRGIACLYQGDGESAAEAFSQALSYEQEAVTPDLRKDILYYQAEAYERMSDPANAVSAYTKILELSGDEVVALMKRGLAYEQMGDDANAVKDLRQTIKKSKKSYAVYRALYQSLSRQGKDEEAKAVLQEALELAGTTAEDLYYQGIIYTELGEKDKAKELLQQSYAKGYAPALAGQGEAAYLAGEYKEACSFFEKYFSGTGDNQTQTENTSLDAASWNQYALCLMELSRYEDAVKACQTGLDLQDRATDQALRFNLATAYEKLQQWEDAYAVMKAYHEMYPDDAKGTHEFEFLESRVVQ